MNVTKLELMSLIYSWLIAKTTSSKEESFARCILVAKIDDIIPIQRRWYYDRSKWQSNRSWHSVIVAQFA